MRFLPVFPVSGIGARTRRVFLGSLLVAFAIGPLRAEPPLNGLTEAEKRGG